MATKNISDRQVCLVCCFASLNRDRHKGADELLAQITGQPRKVCIRAMERALRRELIDYGLSLRTAWLTERGWKFLREQFNITNDRQYHQFREKWDNLLC